ncbi:S-adenosyl-L-methionine-dependent methyltransferase [Lentinula raphanica]|nr:S-adenosyl-L-methionine-dependent methyltransferase [Lentinula raphanica]
MSRRRSALDVSFQDEQDTLQTQPVASTSSQEGGPGKPAKRRLTNAESLNPPKRVKLPPGAHYYHLAVEHIQESANMRIAGEDDDSDESDTSKRIRNLWDFTIFDPLHGNKVMSLSSMEQPDGRACKFEAFGKVTMFVENDEDEGQEADSSGPQIVQYVRLSSILNAALDYTTESRQTQHSWYILQMPSPQYKDFLREFYLPHRLAQMLISSALANHQLTRLQFIEEQLARASPLLDHEMTTSDLNAADSVIRDVVQGVCNERPNIRGVPVIKLYLSLRRSAAPADARRRLTARGPDKRKVNIDLAVLQPQNQTPTTVTPLVASLAQRYFRENLRVTAARPRRDPDKERKRQEVRAEVFKDLQRLIKHCFHRAKCRWDYDKADRIGHGSRYLKAVTVDGVRYEIGDTVMTRIGDELGIQKPGARNKDEKSLPSPTEVVPGDKSFEDYFWFARIINIDIDLQVAHVQWFEHGKATAMGELAHPQELFIQVACDPIALKLIIAKAKVHYLQADNKGRFPDTENIPYGEYFCKFEHDPRLASFTTIRKEFLSIDSKGGNCVVCGILHKAEETQHPIWDDQENTLTFRGRSFHIDDYILYESSEVGPGLIGQIRAFPETSRNAIQVKVRKLGRMSNLKKIIPNQDMIDERELFFTEDLPANYDWIPATSCLKVCHVIHAEPGSPEIENWIMHGPEHFYVSYCFSSIKVQLWNSKRPIERRQVTICRICHQERVKEVESLNEFLTYQLKHPLRALDVFGGSGAFGMALANGSSCFDVTHAIEIAPSAAQTYQQNSPNTAVHNVCVNEAVQYLVKMHQGVHTDNDVPINRMTGEPEEFSLKPGDTEVLVAGFPCQPHSSQNMYKVANDTKTNLILPLLSLIDFLRQKIVVLENVLGFLYCPLMAVQKGKYRLEGGIEQGVLKLIIRVLIEMGYQVRFSLLQAAHYGAPQSRVRFFMIASQADVPLPELPQPTHHFPREGVAPYMRISLKNDRTIEPIETTPGTALLPLVTVADAIGDLRRFDWKHPSLLNWTVKQRQEAARRRVTIPTVPCRTDLRAGWGLGEDLSPYEHRARTRFQMEARVQAPASHAQHYTRHFPPKTVERVVNIKLEPGSDFRGLPPHLSEFQYWNPTSSIAKNRGIKSLYKRLDPDRYFMTTMTNVSPTAKQCVVIHPFCRRILTVRELARSQGFPDHYSFFAIDDNIITHRCIGNAVPWQLSLALGREVKKALHEKWKKREQIVID